MASVSKPSTSTESPIEEIGEETQHTDTSNRYTNDEKVSEF